MCLCTGADARGGVLRAGVVSTAVKATYGGVSLPHDPDALLALF